ncbi:hypothetical protein GHT89_16345 [Acinetobacter baumannii]|uniref:hypothetical protein n=1 Tax=Acinetobacter baumannii TaxID=470 RepID=UPI00387DCD56
MLKEISKKYFLVLNGGKIKMVSNRPTGKTFSIVSLSEMQQLVNSNSHKKAYTLIWQRFSYRETDIEGSGQYVFSGVVYNRRTVFEVGTKKGNGFASWYQAIDILGLDENLKADIEN